MFMNGLLRSTVQGQLSLLYAIGQSPLANLLYAHTTLAACTYLTDCPEIGAVCWTTYVF